MSIKRIYTYILLFIGLVNKAQINLVPNYSFEDTINGCSNGMGVPNLSNWYRANVTGTPDLYSYCYNSTQYPSITSIPYNCRTYQYPQQGNFYIGLWIYELFSSIDSAQIISESIGVQLKQPLKSNTCYYGEMYVNLGNVSNIAINQISMLFTANSYTTSMFSFTNTIQPQIQWDTTKYFTDTLNWIKISGTFVAQGGEQYLTIGNFKDGTHLKKTYIGTNFIQGACSSPANVFKNYYDVDNISLYELPTPQLTSSYTLCPNSDSLVIGDTTRMQTRYQWYVNGVLKDTTSYIKIKPNQTTTYVLHTTNCNTTTQTVVVTYSNNCEPLIITEPTIPNVFTPNGDDVNDSFEFKVVGAKCLVFGVYNRWGNEVFRKELLENQTTNNQAQTTILWDGRTTSGIECTSGVYFYTLQYTDAKGDTQKKNGYVTLIR